MGGKAAKVQTRPSFHPTTMGRRVSKCLGAVGEWMDVSERRTVLDAVSENPSTHQFDIPYAMPNIAHEMTVTTLLRMMPELNPSSSVKSVGHVDSLEVMAPVALVSWSKKARSCRMMSLKVSSRYL